MIIYKSKIKKNIFKGLKTNLEPLIKKQQKTNESKFRIDKLIKKESDQLCVKWKLCHDSFNNWINENGIG